MTILAWCVAWLLDFIIGDPQNWPHPVRWIGKLIVRTGFTDDLANNVETFGFNRLGLLDILHYVVLRLHRPTATAAQ